MIRPQSCATVTRGTRTAPAPPRAGPGVDLDIGHDRDDRVGTLGVGNAASGHDITALAAPCAGAPGLPACFLRRRLDGGSVARFAQVFEPEFHWVRTRRIGHFVD